MTSLAGELGPAVLPGLEDPELPLGAPLPDQVVPVEHTVTQTRAMLPPCAGCGEPVEDEGLSALGHSWHR